jgi:polyphenol oxidase
MITVDDLSAIPGIRHGFFGRNAPGETNAARNCAYRAGDNPADVDANRAACALAVGTPLTHLVTVKQRHTPDVVVATAPLADAPIADALVTATPGLSIGILTADCVPVLLAARAGNVIGAAHAGWRGAFDGVLENTVAKMENLGAQRGDIIAAIGPCIGAASYEVGPEFLQRFVDHDSSFKKYFDRHRSDGHCHFDIAAFAADRLKSCGVARVIVTSRDTCAEEALFFSYRRSVLRKEPDYGRQLSLIAIAP